MSWSSPSRPGTAVRLAAGLAVLAACAMSQAACGIGRQDAAPAADTATATATPPPAGSTPSPADEATGSPARPTSTAGVEVERDRGEPALVTGVRFGRHDSFDRVVVDLKGAVPGYTVRWVDELLQEGSGKPVDLQGHPCLYVLLTPANAHTDDGRPTWTGGPVPHPLGNITSAISAGDFEGRVVIGLVASVEAPFRVKELAAPNRLVIDVAH